MRLYSQKIYDAVAKADRTKLGVQLGCVCIDAQIPVQAVAKWFKVSRQAIYYWFTGVTGIKPAHEERAYQIIEILNAAVDDEALPAESLEGALKVITKYKEKLKCESTKQPSATYQLRKLSALPSSNIRL